MTAMANRPPMSIKVVGLGGSMAVPSRGLATLEVVRVARNFQQGAALDEECERAKARLSLAVS